MRTIRCNARLMCYRLHFSAWKDHYRISNASTRRLSLMVLRAWRNLAKKSKMNTEVLRKSFYDWSSAAFSQRRQKQALNRIVRQQLVRNSFRRFYNGAIVVPDQRVRLCLQKRFFKRWNICATAQEIRRQHSKLSFVINRPMSPIITTPYKRQKPKVKTYGRKPSAPKVRFNAKKSPQLLERKMNIVLRGTRECMRKVLLILNINDRIIADVVVLLNCVFDCFT